MYNHNKYLAVFWAKKSTRTRGNPQLRGEIALNMIMIKGGVIITEVEIIINQITEETMPLTITTVIMVATLIIELIIGQDLTTLKTMLRTDFQVVLLHRIVIMKVGLDQLNKGIGIEDSGNIILTPRIGRQVVLGQTKAGQTVLTEESNTVSNSRSD